MKCAADQLLQDSYITLTAGPFEITLLLLGLEDVNDHIKNRYQRRSSARFIVAKMVEITKNRAPITTNINKIEKRYQNTPLYTIIDEIHEDNIYATSLIGTKVYLKDTLSGMGGGCQVQIFSNPANFFEVTRYALQKECFKPHEQVYNEDDDDIEFDGPFWNWESKHRWNVLLELADKAKQQSLLHQLRMREMGATKKINRQALQGRRAIP